MFRVIIKKRSTASPPDDLSLKEFIRMYMNRFFFEFNLLLSSYRSVQEHGNRAKILDFIKEKKKEFAALAVAIKGGYFYENLKVAAQKKNDCIEQGNRIVEIADHLAGIYENMKLSFIPKPHYKMAIWARENPWRFFTLSGEQYLKNQISNKDISGKYETHKMTIADSLAKTKSEIDFSEISRLIKIYMLKEDIDNYRIDEGTLHIFSEYLEAKVVLCGVLDNPEWRLVGMSFIEDKSTIMPQTLAKIGLSISAIISFLSHYDSLKNASMVYNAVKEHVRGFEKAFHGKVHSKYIEAKVVGGNFYFTITENNDKVEYKNKNYRVLLEKIEEQTQNAENAEEASKSFKTDILDENIPFFFNDGIFLAISRNCGVIHIGKIIKNKIECTTKLHVYGDSVGTYYSHNSTEGTGDGCKNITAPDELKKTLITNEQLLKAYYEILRLNIDVRLYSNKIDGMYFQLEPGFLLKYGISESKIAIEYQGSSLQTILNKIYLLYLQNLKRMDWEAKESEYGEKLLLVKQGMQIMLTETFKSNYKMLNEDCASMNFKESLEYAERFGEFYKINLLPTKNTSDSVFFNFSYATKEMVQVVSCGENYRISSSKTMRAIKQENEFKKNDLAPLKLLYKLYLLDRFFYLKSIFGAKEGNTIALDSGDKILLTNEGIHFINTSAEIHQEYTRVLNVERDLSEFLKRIKNGSIAVNQN